MLEKIEKIIKIEIDATKTIFVEKTIDIVENGNVISSTIHRSSFEPYESLKKLPLEAQNIASTIWTKEIIDIARSKKLSGPSFRIGE